MPSFRGLSILTALLALVLTGCGADEQEVADDDVVENNEVSVIGRDDLTWDREELTADTGTITVRLVCESAVEHNFTIEETDEEVVACAPGETVTGTVDLQPGDYTYVCTVPGHEITMRGTLTVNP